MTPSAQREQAKKAIAYGFLVEEDEQSGNLNNRFVQLFFTALDARKALACSSAEVQVVICEESAADVSPLNLAAALHKDNPLRDIYVQKSNPKGLFISRLEAAGARGSISACEAEMLLGLPPATGESSAAGFLKKSELPEFLDAYFIEGEDAPFTFERVPDEDTLSVEDSFSEPSDPAHQRENLILPEVRISSAPLDMTWLEDILDLEDLDDIPFAAAQLVVERPACQQQEQERVQPPEPKPLAALEPTEDSPAVVAAFVSGRGGVGKSSLAVLTAMNLWSGGAKVALLDMDLQFGDLSVLAGNEPAGAIRRLSLEQLCLEQCALHPLKDELLLVEPPATPELAEELVSFVPHVLASLRSVADIVLINTSCLWDEALGVLARSADKLVVCMDQRATSISAARQVTQLCVKLQIPSTHLMFLLNRCARNAPITSIDAALAMGGAPIITIAEGGTDVDELLSLGCPLELLSAQPALRQSIQELGALLAKDLGQAHPSTRRGMWSR